MSTSTSALRAILVAGLAYHGLAAAISSERLSQLPPAAQGANDKKTTCGSDTIAGVPVRWCTQNGADFDHSRVLWYFHGLDEYVDSFVNSAHYTAIKTYWRTVYGVPPPVIIAISYGNAWTLSDQPSTHVSGSPVLYRLVVDQVIPQLERKLLGRTPDQRWLMGKSMGSYNASLLVERNGALWNKVVLGCPAMFTITPFATAAERDAYVARNPGSSRENVDLGLSVLGQDEPTLPLWASNNPLDPSGLAQLSAASPPLFVWYNLADNYGFGEGARAFIAAATSAGTQVGSASNAGDHCLLDSTIEMNIAQFLR